MSGEAVYFVEIVAYDTDEVVKRIGPIPSERRADKVDDGANQNLDHQDYFTRIVKEAGNAV